MAITKREKYILSLLNSLKKPLPKIKLVKLMFLISSDLKTNGQLPPYSFVPYKFGPFSFLMYHDLNRLEKNGYIIQNEKNIEIIKKEKYNLDSISQNVIDYYIQKFGNWDEKKILDHVYSKFPKFTIYNEITIRKETKCTNPELISLGYEGLSIDDFINLLLSNEINMVIDVRNNSFSMKYGFSKRVLHDILNNFNIEYLHIPELGIPSKLRKQLITYDDYQKLFNKYSLELESKVDILMKVKQLCEQNRVAIMCFEKDEKYCHRNVIIKRLNNGV